MNVYVIYKFLDTEFVDEILKKVEDEIGKDKIYFYRFDLRKKEKYINWHKQAKNKLKCCNQVVFFDTITSDCENVKHINWELKMAKKYNKRIVTFKKDMTYFSEKLYDRGYSGEKNKCINRVALHPKDIKEIVNHFKNELNWRMSENLIQPLDVFIDNKYLSTEDDEKKSMEIYKNMLLEQYRLMIETSEKLMDRRQNSVNLYITICAALLTLVGATFSFQPSLIPGLISFIVGIIITILCFNWLSLLDAYSLNNYGKFEVINGMEKYLAAEMFQCEYKFNTLNGIKSYSTREKKLPYIFMILGVMMIIVGVTILVTYFMKNNLL